MIVAAVVLAAGKSKRMRQNKLLLPLNGFTVIENVLNAVAAADIKEKVVVLGHDPEEMIDAIKHWQDTVQVVINPDYEQGMISSFQKGLRPLRYVDAAFLVLGDQPILDKSLLDVMMQRLENHQDVLIVSPIYKGKKGHPVLFRKDLFSEILSLGTNEIIRDVIHRHASRLLTVEAQEWTIIDMDTLEDYLRIRNLVKLRSSL